MLFLPSFKRHGMIMKALFKWVAIAVLAVLLVPVLIGLVASIIIDPNDFKPQIIEVVEKNTRGSLAIDGELNWSIFPSIGVELNEVRYSLPEDREQAFAALDGVELSVKLLPLLGLAVEADGLTVRGLKLNLHTDKNGVANWERIFPEGGSASADGNSSDDGNGVAAGPLAVDIAKIAIVDSAVHMSNAQDGSETVLNNFNFESTNISANGDQFPLDMSFNVALSEPALQTQAQVKALLAADMREQLFSFEQLNADFLLSGEPFANEKVSLSLSSRGQFDGANSAANLEELSVALAGELNANMQLQATGLDDKPTFKGKVSVPSFSLPKLLQALGMEAPEFKRADAMSSISFDGTLAGPANSFLLNPVTLKLDDTNLQGRMGISNLDKNAYVFVLKGDRINIDDYSSPASDEEVADESDPSAALLPLAALRDLLFRAEFGLQEVIAGGLTISDLAMTAIGNKGLIKLTKLGANMYEGTMSMTATVDGRSDNPSIQMNAKLNSVQLRPLMVDFADLSTVSGTAFFDANLRTRGNSTAAFQSSLNGPVKFGIEEAKLNNLNVDKLACQAIAQVRQKPLDPAKQWPATTEFRKLGGTFQFVDGVGKNDDLAATLDNMQVKGGGVLDLNAETVDYRVALHITGDLSEPGEDGTESACAINEKYRDIGWPIRCKGALSDDPGDLCGIDTSGLGKVAKQLLKAEAKKKLTEKFLGDAPKEGEEEDPEDALKRKLLEKLF